MIQLSIIKLGLTELVATYVPIILAVRAMTVAKPVPLLGAKRSLIMIRIVIMSILPSYVPWMDPNRL